MNTIKQTTDRAACVNTAIRWIPFAEQQPPLGTKLLLINEADRSAVIGVLAVHDTITGRFTHWQALPTFAAPQARCWTVYDSPRRPSRATAADWQALAVEIAQITQERAAAADALITHQAQRIAQLEKDGRTVSHAYTLALAPAAHYVQDGGLRRKLLAWAYARFGARLAKGEDRTPVSQTFAHGVIAAQNFLGGV